MYILTQEDAARAYVEAWKNLSCKDFIKLLSEDTRYSSQWVFDELVGKSAITDYLKGKFDSVRYSKNQPVTAELGYIAEGPHTDEYCACMCQGSDHVNLKAVVLFDVRDNKLKRFDMCIPSLLKRVKIF